MSTTSLKIAIESSETEITAVITAREAVAAARIALDNATATGGDVETATLDLSNANTALTTLLEGAKIVNLLSLIRGLKITDFGMVSNTMAKKLLLLQGKPVKFSEPINVMTDNQMNPIV